MTNLDENSIEQLFIDQLISQPLKTTQQIDL